MLIICKSIKTIFVALEKKKKKNNNNNNKKELEWTEMVVKNKQSNPDVNWCIVIIPFCGTQRLFTIYMGKPVGRRFVQMVSKNPQWKIPFRIGVYHLYNPY